MLLMKQDEQQLKTLEQKESGVKPKLAFLPHYRFHVNTLFFLLQFSSTLRSFYLYFHMQDMDKASNK